MFAFLVKPHVVLVLFLLPRHSCDFYRVFLDSWLFSFTEWLLSCPGQTLILCHSAPLPQHVVFARACCVHTRFLFDCFGSRQHLVMLLYSEGVLYRFRGETSSIIPNIKHNECKSMPRLI